MSHTTHVVIPKPSHSGKLIAYIVISIILLLVSLYFFIGKFYTWWPYRQVDNTSNNNSNNTSFTAGIFSTTTKNKNQRFNDAIFYFSIAGLVISSIVLIIIIVAGSLGLSRKGEIHHFTHGNDIAIKSTTNVYANDIPVPSDRSSISPEAQELLLQRQRAVLLRRQELERLALESQLAPGAYVDPEKIAAQELLLLQDPNVQLSPEQRAGMERALETEILARQSMAYPAPSIPFSYRDQQIALAERQKVLQSVKATN